MNNHPDSTTEEVKAPVVTFSNIPLDDDPPVPAFDSIPEPEDVTVVGVQFKKGGKVYFFDPGKLDIATGDEVIIDTARGAEYGFCAEGNHTVPAAKVVQPLRAVIRIATDNDRRTRQEYKDKEPHAFEVCQNKILDHKLDMKLVSAEYSFDGSKILFYFTADGRVDFRDLVKDLAGVFRTRIELRQIGVRDEAKMMGGLGICGRPFCCKQFLDDFQPVSIKMAKTQSLSLNPTKISGTCGRLMCCLKYEQAAYEDLMKDAPRMDSFVETPDGAGTIISVNTLREKVRVRLDSAPDTLKTYHNSEIRVVRSGKGKRPEGYVEPPKQELAKLRKFSESPEDQARREQEALAAALNGFLEEDEASGGKREGGKSRRRLGGDKGRNARKAERELEADWEREKEKQQARHRSKPRPKPAAPEGKPPFLPDGEAPKEEDTRRRRGSRGRGRKPGVPRKDKPTEARAPNTPAEGKPSPAPEKGEKSGEGTNKPHRRWHHRGRRRPGGGANGGGSAPTPPAAN